MKKRGKSDVGAKTMLDVLVPVLAAFQRGCDRHRAARIARQPGGDQAHAGDPRARLLSGRALDRPLDPGATSSCLLIQAACDVLEPTA